MKTVRLFLLFLIVSMFPISSFAQDTSQTAKENLFKKILESIKKDTTGNPESRLDEKFRPFEGSIIRDIITYRVPFGISLADTSKKLINSLTKAANYLHHLTGVEVIKENLFFKKQQPVRPLLFADNEQYLRQLPYFQDAEIVMVPIAPQSDSVDVIVLTKDIFSFGGAIGSLGAKKTDLEVREDNIAGTGNGAALFALYDSERKGHVSLGGEYVQRNIKGTFIDVSGGYRNYYSTVPGPKQENYYYVELEKPLVNRYMNWTYAFNARWHSTKNRYLETPRYNAKYNYEFGEIELWTAANLHAGSYSREQEDTKLRKLVGTRIINRGFVRKPDDYKTDYYWRFSNLFAVLGSLSFYRQNFYKTNYIYGFGRSEDIPEGLLLEFTTGYTKKEGRERPFLGFNYERYRYNRQGNYLGYTLRAEGHLDKKALNDVNLLVAASYFDHLKPIGKRWKQRFFLNLDGAQQINNKLNEPLLVNSIYGLPEFGPTDLGGTFRGTVKAESVFFSPYQLAAFKFAPFVFTNLNVFSPYKEDTRVYASLGGGLRMRNESLIFGTIQLKGFYFPQQNFSGDHFRFEISTNVIYEYKRNFVIKPDFIKIN